MKKLTPFIFTFVLLIIILIIAVPTRVQASTPDPLLGHWYGEWQLSAGYSGRIKLEILTDDSAYYAVMNIPGLAIFDETWPVEVTGDGILLGGAVAGTIDGDMIQGGQYFFVEYPPGYDWLTWYVIHGVDQNINIGPGPGSTCDDLPQLFCTGTAEYCSELVPFDPVSTAGYIDYPVNGETWENQYRSYLRRDLMQLISYATAKLQCQTETWEFGSSYPLGLVDMSEADGSVPGTSIGKPGHVYGHEDGRDIDVSYYQYYTLDQFPRAVCDYSEGYAYAYHCTSEPYLLDPWRTALFTSILAEHPHLRVMGVDGRVGPVLEDSLDWFSTNGWFTSEYRNAIPLAYEETDTGLGWYHFHHHHMHISMNPVQPILQNLEFEPETLNLQNSGKYITAYIELAAGFDPIHIDLQSVIMTVDGLSILYADGNISEIGDHNENGIPDLMVKFDRAAVQAMLPAGDVEITLYGSIGGLHFQGVDSIFVIPQK